MTRAAPILISVSVSGQYQCFLMVSELVKYVIQVPILLLLIILQSCQAKIIDKISFLSANSMAFSCIGISTCTCEYSLEQYLVLEVLVKSGISAALLVTDAHLPDILYITFCSC